MQGDIEVSEIDVLVGTVAEFNRFTMADGAKAGIEPINGVGQLRHAM